MFFSLFVVCCFFFVICLLSLKTLYILVLVSARYPIGAISSLEWRRWFGLSLGIFHLHAKGIFGQKILFLGKKKVIDQLHVAYPEWLKA